MKEGLKTLKDIAFPRQGGSCYKVEKLKAEAIKWVKFYKQRAINAIHVSHVRDCNGSQMMALMEFFNITEDDLKDKGWEGEQK
ncbi:MAG: hypothetical protein ACFFG0_02865 [Candidatus Thorarchaeota archaeon]